MMDRADATRKVPAYLEGDVNAKIENVSKTTRRDGSQALRVEMVVSADGNDWYTMTTYISLDSRYKWLHRLFWEALGYSPEQIETMDLADESLYKEYCTYLMINIAHAGQYVNVKKWYKKQKNNYVPVPWHFPEYEKFGGVAYQAESAPKRPRNEHSLDDLLGPEETTSNGSELTPQAIDLRWVTTNNLIAELKKRGIDVVEKAKTTLKPISETEAYDFVDDLEFA